MNSTCQQHHVGDLLNLSHTEFQNEGGEMGTKFHPSKETVYI